MGSCPNGKVLEASKAQTGEVAQDYMPRAEGWPYGEVRSEQKLTALGKNLPPPMDADPMDRQAGTA